MEYKIFHKIRQKIKIPYIFRVILGIISIIFGVIMLLVPPVPGFVFLITGVLFLIPVDKIKDIRKIRKGFVHLLKNLNSKKIIKRKFFDLVKHGKNFFKSKKLNKKNKKIK